MKTLPRLTRKQAAFVGELVANPKMSATQAALKTYNVTSSRSAEVVASENMRKPEIMKVLRDAAVDAENAVKTVMDSSLGLRSNPAHAGIALSAANSLLDRVHGKATQRTETVSTTLSISIDLSGGQVIEAEEAS